MNLAIEKQIKILFDSVTSDNFIDIAYDVVLSIQENEDAFDAIEPILRLIENNPYIDFGTPGPLVQFMEKYYKKGYEEKLIESLKRHPTKHTIWMLNRIINGSEGERKSCYLDVFNELITRHDLDEDSKTIIKILRE